MPTHAHKLIVADDHPLFRTALRQALSQAIGACEIHEAEDMQSLQRVTAAHSDCDLMLLDLHMPGAHGFSGLIFINGHYPDIPVMIVSANENPEIMRRAIEYGAAGFLPKSTDGETISKAIAEVLAGEIWLPQALRNQVQGGSFDARAQKIADAVASLTPQQFRVSTMLAAGLLNKQIAYEMNVTEATVKAHLTALFRKLGVSSRTQAVLAISHLDVEPSGQFDATA